MVDTQTTQTRRDTGLTTNALKLIAIAAMVIDHIAWAFVPDETPLAIVMHFIGRITGPTMFYFAVEGYHHTRSVNRYTARLAIFALISYFPFMYFMADGVIAEMDYLQFNVIYTILLGVLAVRVRRELKNPVLKTILILVLIVLCVPADWSTWGITIIIVFDYFRGNFRHQAFGYTMIVMLQAGMLSLLTYPVSLLLYAPGTPLDPSVYIYNIANLGMFLPLILLKFYNGQKGTGGRFMKWLFYLFYPAHLLILGLIRALV
jgi:hypothetical protein